MIDVLICPLYTFNLRSCCLQSIFTNNCYSERVLNETKKEKNDFIYSKMARDEKKMWNFFCIKIEKWNVPDDNVVSVLETAVADDVDDDDDDDVSAWIHGGPCIIEPSGGWSHWSKASLACCCWWWWWIVGFFIWVLVGDSVSCCSSFPLVVVADSLIFDVEFSVFNFDKPLLRWCRGDNVATVFGGGGLK